MGLPLKRENFYKAAGFAIEYSLDISRTIANQSGFSLWIILKTCLEPYCFLTFSHLNPDHLNNEATLKALLGEGYSNIHTFHNIVMESDMPVHYARCLARSGHCWFFEQVVIANSLINQV
jgi:hypothetical protein